MVVVGDSWEGASLGGSNMEVGGVDPFPLLLKSSQVIEGTRDAEVVLARAGPATLGPPPTVKALSISEPPDRHEGSSAAAAVPSSLRLQVEKEAGGRHVRVQLGAVKGWENSSSSLIPTWLRAMHDAAVAASSLTG